MGRGRLLIFGRGALSVSVLEAPRRVIASHELLWNLTLRELRTKYRRSILGWSWSMLNPLATVAIYSFVFGHLFRAVPPTGDPSGRTAFALYLLCGLLPWNFFVLVTTSGMTSVISNAALVRKVAFPREVLVFANSLHGIVQFGIEMSLLVIVLVFSGPEVLLWIPLVLVQMLLILVFSSGVALAFSAGCVYFRDLSYLWQIGSQMLFFATPIVYTQDIVQDRLPGWIVTTLEWSPIALFVRGFRATLYDGRFPGWLNLTGSAVAALVSLTLGWIVFSRLSRRFAEEL